MAKIIGRDKLLQKRFLPRLRKNIGYAITGQPGIGKSALLKWSFDYYKGKKVFFSCDESYSDILRKIAKVIDDQELAAITKTRITEIEKAVLQTENEFALFIDDLDRVKPKILLLLKMVRDKSLQKHYPIFCTARKGFDDKVKPLIWGNETVFLKPINEDLRTQLVKEIAESVGKVVDVDALAKLSKGVPGRAVSIIKGEATTEDFEYVEEEEVNIGWILLLWAIFFVCLRYVGIGMSERELYLMGGLGTGCLLFVRLLVFRTMKR